MSIQSERYKGTYDPRREQMRAFKKWGFELGTIPTMDELTDEQWELVAPLIPPEAGRGRPRADARRVLNGVLYAIRNALTWANIPPEYPSYVTLFRRYHEWLESGVLEQVIYTLTRHLGEVSGLDYEKALGTCRLSFHQQDGILTLYLPPEYSEYWMQPTAALLLMWLVARTLGIYAEAYRRTCKEQRLQRLPDRAGPRKSRPREVVLVVGENPEKLRVAKPDLARERMEFMDRMSR